MSDYTEEERREIRQRAHAALQSCDETQERLAARAQARAMAGADLPAPQQQPAPVPARQQASERPIQQPTMAPDYWAKWETWTRAIAEERIAAFSQELCEGIGQASAESSNALYAKLRGEIAAAVAAAKAELRAEFAVERRLAALEARMGMAEPEAERSAATPALRVA